MFQRFVFAALMPLFFGLSSASAEEWKVTGIDGDAQVQKFAGWALLHLGDAIPKGVWVRTMPNGSLTLKRDGERISLAPYTQIQINDRAGQNATSVDAKYGTVGIEAGAEDIRYVLVQTPYLTATAKWANFGVSTDSLASAVSVLRGGARVADVSDRMVADISADQTARAGRGLDMIVTPLSINGLGGAATEEAQTAGNASNQASNLQASVGSNAGTDASNLDRSAQHGSDALVPWGRIDGGDLDKVVRVAGEASAPDQKVNVNGLGDVGNSTVSSGSLDLSRTDKIAVAGRAATAKGVKSRLENDDVTDEMEAAGASMKSDASASAAGSFETQAAERRREREKAIAEGPLLNILSEIDARYLSATFVGLFVFNLAIGKLLDQILRDESFGPAVNGLVVVAGFLIGAVVRDHLFFGTAWRRYEPDLSIVLIIGTSLIILIVSLFLRYCMLNGLAARIKAKIPDVAAIGRLQRRQGAA